MHASRSNRTLFAPRTLQSTVLVAVFLVSIASAYPYNVMARYKTPTCQGLPAATYPISGSTIMGQCYQVDLSTSVIATCDNTTGLTLNIFGNGHCKGFASTSSVQVNRCIPNWGLMSGTAYFCTDVNPASPPSLPGKPIPGAGTLEWKRYDSPASVPKHVPYKAVYSGSGCSGPVQYADTFDGIEANTDKCYNANDENRSAICTASTNDQPGKLTISKYQSGCSETPFETEITPTGTCLFGIGNSYIAHCGNQ